MKTVAFILSLGMGLSSWAQVGPAKKCSELSAEKRANIGSGKTETLQTPVSSDKSVLSEITQYMKVSGTPREAMAAYLQFIEPPKYTIRSQTVQHESDANGPVLRRTYDISPGPTLKELVLLKSGVLEEDYKLTQQIRVVKSKKPSYELVSNQSKSKAAHATTGFVSFEEVDGFVCMTYSNRVIAKVPLPEVGNTAARIIRKGIAMTFKVILDETMRVPRSRMDLIVRGLDLESQLSNSSQTVASVNASDSQMLSQKPNVLQKSSRSDVDHDPLGAAQ